MVIGLLDWVIENKVVGMRVLDTDGMQVKDVKGEIPTDKNLIDGSNNSRYRVSLI